MSFELKQATRTNVKPLICFYGESGSGKSFSSLLMARGFVGPKGRIAMIDTESGRGSLYADCIPGGYETITLSEPFSPMRAVEAIQSIERSGVSIGILDSASHFWEGLGGVIDMADQNEQKSGKPGLHNWRLPKMEHTKFVLKLLQSPIPWIICLRAKYKTRQGKNAQGKTEIVKDDFPTEIQHEGFVYEMTVHGLIDLDHRFILRKASHPELRKAMPNNEPVRTEHGELLARWCASAGSPPNGTAKRTATEKTRNWFLDQTKDMHADMDKWARENGILTAEQSLADWPLDRTPTTKAELEAFREQVRPEVPV